MDIQEVLECKCNPGKTYTSHATFRRHFLSQRHALYQHDQNKIDLHKRLQEARVELEKKTRECEIWKQKYFDEVLQNDFHDCLPSTHN